MMSDSTHTLQHHSSRLGRRGFFAVSAALAAGSQLALAAEPAARETPLDLAAIPNFCAHEHWGSIGSIGMVGEGFRADVQQGATPSRRTGLLDILHDPYIGMTLGAAGLQPDDAAKRAGAKNLQDLADRSPVEAVKVVRALLQPYRMTGTYQCIRRGLLALHGADLESRDDAELARLDASIARRYENLFAWYVEAMGRCRFSELIRPMQPEFFLRQQSPETAAVERKFTRSILRVDPLLGFWRTRSGRREVWVKALGVDPVDAATWRRFLGEFFDLAAKNRTTGIKQMQAYWRPLDYRPVADTEVVWRGELTAAQVRLFEDWMMNECCKQAHDRGWPHQVHVGTHNIPDSRPLPLGNLAARYPKMKLVMIHCWPYLKEAGWLAAQYGNIYIDTDALPLFGPGYLREALAGWLGYMPAHKIMCSHDGTSIEMAAGSALFTREVLGELLVSQSRGMGLGAADLRAVAADLLHNNSVRLYGVGKRVG